MSEGAIPIKKAVPIIVVTWILSLVSTLAIVYVAPNIFPIQTAQIKDGAVTDDKISSGAVITAKLADGSVTTAKILDGTINATDLTDGSIISVKISDGAVTTAKITDAAVTTNKLSSGSVTSIKILDGTITAVDLADGAIVTAKIADGAVTTTKIADGSVTTAKILDGTITAADLATGSVTTIKIADGAITTAKIADGAVTNLKLAPDAIPFASTYGWWTDSTDSTLTWVDMDDMSISITLERTSHLLIMFSTEAWTADVEYRIQVRALVGLTAALPGEIDLTPTMSVSALNDHTLYWMAYSYNFYQPSVTAGTYTVKMQWRVTGTTGYAYLRTLSVIALPA